MKGLKTGGRASGTPNKATAKLKAFLEPLFEDAFADPMFRVELLLQITTLTIDVKLLQTLLAYNFGAPSKSVEHKHSGSLTLEQLVAGLTVEDEDEDA
jgi:hypothetical protein